MSKSDNERFIQERAYVYDYIPQKKHEKDDDYELIIDIDEDEGEEENRGIIIIDIL